MKKILLSALVILSIFVTIPLVHAEEAKKINVYMITKDGCPACEKAKEYFEDLNKKHPDLFTLINLEVFDSKWNFRSTSYEEIFKSIYDYFGENSSKAQTPTIVIGEYHTVGLPQDTSVIYNEIENARTSSEYRDVVKELGKELNIDVDDLNEKDVGGKYDAIIIIGIFAVLIAGIAGMFVASKK